MTVNILPYSQSIPSHRLSFLENMTHILDPFHCMLVPRKYSSLEEKVLHPVVTGVIVICIIDYIAIASNL